MSFIGQQYACQQHIFRSPWPHPQINSSLNFATANPFYRGAAFYSVKSIYGKTGRFDAHFTFTPVLYWKVKVT